MGCSPWGRRESDTTERLHFHFMESWACLVAQSVKNLPAGFAGDAGKAVRSLGQEDPLEKEMATHSSILAWEIPWTEEPGRLYSP